MKNEIYKERKKQKERSKSERMKETHININIQTYKVTQTSHANIVKKAVNMKEQITAKWKICIRKTKWQHRGGQSQSQSQRKGARERESW